MLHWLLPVCLVKAGVLFLSSRAGKQHRQFLPRGKRRFLSLAKAGSPRAADKVACDGESLGIFGPVATVQGQYGTAYAVLGVRTVRANRMDGVARLAA